MTFNADSSMTMHRALVEKWYDRLDPFLQPMLPSHQREYRKELEDIIAASLELDMEISRQVAIFQWFFPPGSPQVCPPNTTKRVSRGESQNIILVSDPGLVKHGKSSGDAFDLSEVLLEPEMFCRPSQAETSGIEPLPNPHHKTSDIRQWPSRLRQGFSRLVEGKTEEHKKGGPRG